MNTIILDVIILSYAKNEALKRLTIQTVETLIGSEQPENVGFNILVIESNKSLRPYQYPQTNTIYPYQKFNFNKYLNIGIQQTSSEYICFSNNDVIFHKNWATKALKEMKENNILCASTYWENYHYGEHNIKPNTGNVAGYRELFSGWCFLVKRSLFDKIELFDERITFWYSDDDFCKTLEHAGIKNYLITNSNVTHVGGYSLTHISESDRKKLTVIPFLYYDYKWKHKSKLLYYFKLYRYKTKLLLSKNQA